MIVGSHLRTAAPTKPHHPFFGTFEGSFEETTYLYRKPPAAVPTQPPIGCEREPQHYSWSWTTGSLPAEVGPAWKEWLTLAEAALCRRLEFFGLEAAKHSGRSQGLVLVKSTLSSRSRSSTILKFCPKAIAWRSLSALAARVRVLRGHQGPATYRCSTCGIRMANTVLSRDLLCAECQAQLGAGYTCCTCDKAICRGCVVAASLTPTAQDEGQGPAAPCGELVAALRHIAALDNLGPLPAALGDSPAATAGILLVASRDHLPELLELITTHSRKADVQSRKAAFASWKLRARAMTENGGALAHDFAKQPRGRTQHPLKHGLPQVGQGAVNVLLEQWTPLWQSARKESAPPPP